MKICGESLCLVFFATPTKGLLQKVRSKKSRATVPLSILNTLGRAHEDNSNRWSSQILSCFLRCESFHQSSFPNIAENLWQDGFSFGVDIVLYTIISTRDICYTLMAANRTFIVYKSLCDFQTREHFMNWGSGRMLSLLKVPLGLYHNIFVNCMDNLII